MMSGSWGKEGGKGGGGGTTIWRCSGQECTTKINKLNEIKLVFNNY